MFRKVFTVTENLAKIPTDHVVFLDWSTWLYGSKKAKIYA
jgi:hypothetical protein